MTQEQGKPDSCENKQSTVLNCGENRGVLNLLGQGIFQISTPNNLRKGFEKMSQKTKPVCLWKVEVDEEDVWNTQCKNTFVFTTGTPKDNDCKFCPYCGREIKVKK